MKSMKTFICVIVLVMAQASEAVLGAGTAASSDDEIRGHIADLASTDEDVCARAKVMLLRPELAARLPAYRDVLLAKLPAVECEADAVILARLNLPAARVAELLDSPNSPDKVKAKLGDEKALARVVNRFRAARTVPELRKAAADLAYLDNKQAGIELGKRLESKEVLTDVHENAVSVVALILQVYWFEHLDELLFAPREYMKYADMTGDQFKQAEPQAYLRQIEEHFRQKYSLDLTIDPPLLLETTKNDDRKIRRSR